MIEKIRAVVCALWGHPPIIETCFGYCHCARCGEQIGDMLAGATGPGLIIVGHKADCPECQAVMVKIKGRDRWFLTTKGAEALYKLRGGDAMK